LAVEQQSTGIVGYRIVSEDSSGLPVVFESGIFDVTDPNLPRSWIVLGIQGATVELGPSEFGTEGFWERVFDLDPDALREFAQARDRVMADSTS
jgi:hypothetical protein